MSERDSNATQVSEETQRGSRANFIGGFGLAQLVSLLASERAAKRGAVTACVFRLGAKSGAVNRRLATDFPSAFPASAEYYRICDRLARGARP